MPTATRTPLAQLEPRRVCLIKPSALGDVVQTLPILAALRGRWPSAHIAWVVHRGLMDVLADHPDLDEVIPFERGGSWAGRTGGALHLAKRLRRGGFDLAIDFQGLLRTGVMARLTGAARRVGFAGAREGAPLAYTDRVAVPPETQAAVERYWALAVALGCRGRPGSGRVGLGDAHRAWAAEQLADLPRPIVAIHPGAQWTTKRWPPMHFAAVAKRAQRETGAGIVLVGGPGDGILAEAIAECLDGPCVNLAERTSLRQLAAVSAAADVFVSGDTGPMHLAAAMQTPVVAVFTCTSPRRAGPHGSGHRVVSAAVACAASYRRKCHSMICMDELSPDRLWPALAATLADVARRQRLAG
ncbi:MAG: glycosyltransferase family 9 protein [Planctomycetales bacterium]|nr:glycosyltransferase family 9 protein [Planctomycetales bacterium]